MGCAIGNYALPKNSFAKYAPVPHAGHGQRAKTPCLERQRCPQDAIDCANVALEKFNIEKDIAAYIKKEFDKKYNPTWHCVVGRNFGSYVTHETKHFIYFYMGQVAVLLFKSG